MFVVLLVALVVLIAENTRSVELDWVFGTSRVSVVWIIVASTAARNCHKRRVPFSHAQTRLTEPQVRRVRSGDSRSSNAPSARRRRPVTRAARRANARARTCGTSPARTPPASDRPAIVCTSTTQRRWPRSRPACVAGSRNRDPRPHPTHRDDWFRSVMALQRRRCRRSWRLPGAYHGGHSRVRGTRSLKPPRTAPVSLSVSPAPATASVPLNHGVGWAVLGSNQRPWD